jgi:hypothetical protein
MSSFFDDEATLAMGAAFDRACSSLGRFARESNVRELIAKRIIESAINGERDPVRLYSAGLHAIRMNNLRQRVTSHRGRMPVATFAAMARAH